MMLSTCHRSIALMATGISRKRCRKSSHFRGSRVARILSAQAERREKISRAKGTPTARGSSASSSLGDGGGEAGSTSRSRNSQIGGDFSDSKVRLAIATSAKPMGSVAGLSKRIEFRRGLSIGMPRLAMASLTKPGGNVAGFGQKASCRFNAGRCAIFSLKLRLFPAALS